MILHPGACTHACTNTNTHTQVCDNITKGIYKENSLSLL